MYFKFVSSRKLALKRELHPFSYPINIVPVLASNNLDLFETFLNELFFLGRE